MRYCPVNEAQADAEACELFRSGLCGLCEASEDRPPRVERIHRPWERPEPRPAGVAAQRKPFARREPEARPVPAPALAIAETAPPPAAAVTPEPAASPAPALVALVPARRPYRKRLAVEAALRQIIREGLERGDHILGAASVAARLTTLTRERYVALSVLVLARPRGLVVRRVRGQDCLALDSRAKAFVGREQ